jgi:predicted RNA-binding Zn-ribbon protein involved in translation (DUF1610 family)
LSNRICPHCGYSLPDDAFDCPCGLTVEEFEVPAPGIVRSTTPLENALKESQPQKSKKAPEKAQVTKPPPRPVRPVKGANSGTKESMLMDCPSCAARISKRAPKCPKCGSSPFLKCQVCSALILANSASCGECGDPEPFQAVSA